MFANFPKPLYVTDCFEYSISLDFVVLKFLLECLLFCSHNLWLPEQQTFLISDWQVPTMITGIFFYLFNSNALKFPSFRKEIVIQPISFYLSLLFSMFSFCLFFFSSFLFCSLFFLLSQHRFVTVQTSKMKGFVFAQSQNCECQTLHVITKPDSSTLNKRRCRTWTLELL